MKYCSIPRVDKPVPLTNDVAEMPWERAPEVVIDEFPWDVPASRESTLVRPLYYDEELFLQYHVDDAHSNAAATDPNGPVWNDSCVELFATLEPDCCPHNANFEANFVGTVRLGFGPDRHNWTLIHPTLAESIRVETSVEGRRRRRHRTTTDGGS